MSVAWNQTLREIEREIATGDLNDFVSQLVPIAEEGRSLVLEAPNRLTADLVGQRYQHLIEAALAHVTSGRLLHLSIRVRALTQQALFPLPPAGEPAAPSRADAGSVSLLPKYTFETFIVGASNQFAHAASRAVATRPGHHYNPLFIYGGVGLGKTHLVNAIGHHIARRNPVSRIVYLSSESFMNELISALRRDRMDSFKNRFRRVDVLILDDVQFLAGRERTQEEFFHTFNSLYDAHRQIVLTSDKFPKEIPDLEERLRNRFEWGLIADIQPPDMETRVAILEKKAEMEQIDLPHEVALFLAGQISSNVRELEGSLTRLGAFASMNRSPITVDFARDVLRSVLGKFQEKNLSIDTIQKAVTEFFRLRPGDLRSQRRTRSISVPRQVAMYLCRRHTEASFPVIGDHFGGRDHSTVIHANRVVERRIREEAEFRTTVEQIERLLGSAAGQG